jgi:hypothetical protein
MAVSLSLPPLAASVTFSIPARTSRTTMFSDSSNLIFMSDMRVANSLFSVRFFHCVSQAEDSCLSKVSAQPNMKSSGSGSPMKCVECVMLQHHRLRKARWQHSKGRAALQHKSPLKGSLWIAARENNNSRFAGVEVGVALSLRQAWAQGHGCRRGKMWRGERRQVWALQHSSAAAALAKSTVPNNSI